MKSWLLVCVFLVVILIMAESTSLEERTFPFGRFRDKIAAKRGLAEESYPDGGRFGKRSERKEDKHPGGGRFGKREEEKEDLYPGGRFGRMTGREERKIGRNAM